MGVVKATGRLRHRFWGEYSAVIALVFPNQNDAAQALKLLGANWQPHETNIAAIYWIGNSEELTVVKNVLSNFGADPNKIDSVAKSIDYGEPFECRFDLESEEQFKLF